MISLFKKEIRAFFNSVTGYLVISVFLALNSLFLWILPDNFNLMDSNYASIENLFIISPWVFLFLIPAITMRMFADEKRTGTMEFLLTKPLTEIQIIVAKYIAALSLVLFSLLPTLLYFYSIYELGNPSGNIDAGATVGSYIGLFLLGGAYVAVGLFASALTDNPIISFILAALLSFFLYMGLDQLAGLNIFGDADLMILNLGINEHYLSISRGVIDSRDVLYFVGLVVLFGAMARLTLQSRKWDKRSRKADFIQFGLIAAIIVVFNLIGSFTFSRIDLTSEKRYSLSEATINLIDRIEDPMLFKIYLKGEYPADLQRLQRETQQMLDEFRAYNRLIEYEFINPSEEDNPEQFSQLLQQRGVMPTTIDVRTDDGRSQKSIYPGGIVAYQDRETAVNLLQSIINRSAQDQVNISIQNLEYNLANTLRRLIIQEKPLIGFTTGHGEWERKYVASISAELAGTYRLDRFNIREFAIDTITGQPSLQSQLRKINSYDLLVIARPTEAFNELDKFLIDQYVMNGGKIMWLVDPVYANMDSLSQASEFLAFPQMEQLNIDDMLFKYGVRLNNVLLQDFNCAGVNDRREVNDWPYYPVMLDLIDHPITKNLNGVKLEFASTIDTIFTPTVKKTPLLVSSQYSREQQMPGIVSLRYLYREKYPEEFHQQFLTTAVLLEGKFESIYRNRLVPQNLEAQGISLRDTSRWTQQIVIADADVIKNQLNLVNPNIERGTPLPLGYDQFLFGTQFGNDDFILNAIDYMLDESGLTTVRTKEFKIRLLDMPRIQEHRLFWLLLNSAVPIGFVLLFGLLYTLNRKRKHAIKA